MNTMLKILAAVCVLGIAVVLGIVFLLDSPVDSAPALDIPATDPPSLAFAPPQSSAAPEPEPTVERDSETQAAEFQIEELTAVCDDETGVFAVSALPLGADWRTTERGVYSGSPVLMTCVTSGTDSDLTYEWSADYGEIDGSGPSVLWVAPGHGARATVAVTVRDSFGNDRNASLVFRVATCDCIFNRY
jgi:hypothetical protein